MAEICCRRLRLVLSVGELRHHDGESARGELLNLGIGAKDHFSLSLFIGFL